MKLPFKRNRTLEPIPETPMYEETVHIETVLPVEPAPPVEPVVQVVPAFVCAFCGQPANPANQFANGDLYLRKLPYNFLCNNHWLQRDALVKHRTKASKPTIVQEAVTLQDRAVNLLEA